jgi:hypothetical protein
MKAIVIWGMSNKWELHVRFRDIKFNHCKVSLEDVMDVTDSGLCAMAEFIINGCGFFRFCRHQDILSLWFIPVDRKRKYVINL